MQPQPYPSDLSDEEWSILAPLPVPARQAGRPRVFEPRRTADAAFYPLRTGCQWRAPPREFPPRPTVHHRYSRRRRSGTWERINAGLRERRRAAIGRDRQPSAAVIGSQSVRTAEVGGPRGYDGGKEASGRKRQVLADTQGNQPAGGQGGRTRPTRTTGAAPSCRWRASPRGPRASRRSGPTAPARGWRPGWRSPSAGR